ncbi:putative O-linked N-acetylglucosamine transferase (SPINDLY family) [Paraburkholderia bannensis]|uniref:protein O-GlcNAc transferase n=1 Tax=Paraburkholderia bannensis TaxID=765414 RepID=A0A7W9TSX4_9BURK|nr:MULTISPECIES: tetratricopeptide repeat protein [Paraburkholderia]MBB3255877.1 putative O-linked N-acetylglucosamine transferase (SPINDLY family) [Paraburkholderia sp. WP4_3_2]MBB6100877.1 putative O-linked N-acetylglucosamine transferase (SPINDLY family) [Paraburkholderia bannensis]
MTAFPTLNDTTTLLPEAQREQDIDLVMQAAIEHHRKQEYADAAALYAAVLDADRDHVDANYHMGVLLMQTDQPAEAVPHFEQVLGHTPNFHQLWVYYFNALSGSGQFEAARASLELALQCGLPPDAVATLRSRLAEESGQAGLAGSVPAQPTPQTEQDIAAKAAPASDADPRRATAAELQEYATLFNAGKIDAALNVARRLTESYPGHGECWLALTHALQRNGHFAESVSAAEPAARLLPDQVIAQTMLADALYIVRRFQRAEEHCRQAIERHPQCAALHRTLGATLQVMGRSAEGIAFIRHAVELAPHDALELDALGNALAQHGEYDEAEITFRRALEMAPTQAPTNSNLLFGLMHKLDLDAPRAFAEFRAFAERFEAPLRAQWQRHANERNPAKRLKIGFVSGDLFDHPVAYFLLSVVEHLALDPTLSLHFYSNYAATDSFTTKIRAHAASWREIFGMSDDVVAQTIRNDGIDILIDLSGHTGRNRLVAFAHKPAPVQVSWIGNPATTGLSAIDYYMSDRFVTPLEQFASQFSEKLVFLPALAPFKPHPEAPDVNELPALKNGYLTFGSFSRIVKIGPEVVALWARVLREVPNSRMLVGAIASTEQMSKIAGMFANENIDASRISFMQRKSVTNYLQQHNMVDVCLDAFPFAGSTTTMHALWMGVPTMTLPGYSMASRGSTGWLSHLGLEDAFVATDKDDFVRKCAALAADPEALAAVRRELRAHCMQSPIVSASTIANAASRALRTMWQRWCDGLAPEHFEVPAQVQNASVAQIEALARDLQSHIATPAAEAAPAAQTAQVAEVAEVAQATTQAAAPARVSAPITSIGMTTAMPSTRKPIRLVCGTRSSRDRFSSDTALGRSLKLYAHLPDLELQLFDSNARGLSSIYNAAIDDAKENPALLVFIHDDVWLQDFFWAERVRESLARFDVMGLAGNLRRVARQPSWAFTPEFKWDERQYLSGAVGHGKGFPCDVASTFGPSGQECKLLDGLLLGADSETLSRSGLRFDEQFTFHFYDLDFCRQAELKRLRMGTWPISVVHESGGAFNSPGWRAGYEQYLRKYGN